MKSNSHFTFLLLGAFYDYMYEKDGHLSKRFQAICFIQDKAYQYLGRYYLRKEETVTYLVFQKILGYKAALFVYLSIFLFKIAYVHLIMLVMFLE